MSNKPMILLLTGATGFLGSHVLSALVRCGHKVHVLIRRTSDLRKIEHLRPRIEIIIIEETILPDIFTQNSFDVIIHCATSYGRQHINPADLLEANLIFPLRLLQYGSAAGVKCFINTDTILDKGISYYSLSKNQFREWLTLYAHKMVCINVALEHFYGPNDDPTKFVSFLVNNLVEEVDHIDLTKGEQKRNFIYIDDVVEAFNVIIGTVDSLVNGYIHYEIGTDQTISVREFAKLVKSLSGAVTTDLRFGAIPYREHEVMEVLVDTSAIRSLGWRPQAALEEGLLKTIHAARGDRNK